MTTCIALLRGINVGRAKRIAMADLRDLIERLGYSRVRTVLNSGNALFEAPRPDTHAIASRIEAAIERRCGFPVPVVVVTAPELQSIVADNSLRHVADDPARLLVAFAAEPATLEKATALLARPWTPEALAVGGKAAYLWCAAGILKSPLLQAFARATAGASTTRNWATVGKLHAAAPSNPKVRRGPTVARASPKRSSR